MDDSTDASLQILNFPLELQLTDIPLIFNDSLDTTNIQNILLIDSRLYGSHIFFDSANSFIFLIFYLYC